MRDLGDLIGSSPPMAALRAQVERLLARPGLRGRLPPILILGETGTGKGLLVRILHKAGDRRDKPLVEINCAAIPENLVEAELFGFERGAFTDARQPKPGLFQAAHRGVLFLDEVGSLPLPVQAKLLTAIEQREVRRLGGTRPEAIDTWIVSATNEDLADKVARREFRLDLYHRISTVTLQMPPLRDRGRDVLDLAHHYLERVSADYGLPPRRLAPSAEAAMLAHAWPGNVRELANLMERVVLLAEREEITAELLELPTAPRRDAPAATASVRGEIDPEAVRAALDATQWNLSRAAARLGVPRNTLRYRIERLGLRPGAPPASSAPADPGAPQGPAAAVPSPPARLRWERRFITALSVALEPPPSVSGFHLTPLLEALVQKIERFAGHVEELHPLGFTALYGLDPMEDAPSRAALAALALQKTVEQAPHVDGQPVGLAVRLATTQGLIARGAFAGGMDLDDRARLRESLASVAPRSGAVVANAEAAAFLGRRFVLEPIGGAPPDAYRLVASSSGVFEDGHRPPAPFVGRERELAQLDDLLVQVERGQGQIAGLVGEPGVGKSRLLHEFRQSLGPDRVVHLEGRGAPHAVHTPYAPIIQLLAQLFLFEESDDREDIARKVRQGVEVLGLAAEGLAPYLLHLLGALSTTEGDLARLGAEAVRRRSLDALRQVVIAASQQRPVILAIEDLQWIDETSAESLMTLAESAAGCRILMLTTYRNGYQPAWLGKSYATQLVVRRLDPEHSLRLVESIASPEAVSGDVAAALVARADGIPFFLEELVRAVADHPEVLAAGVALSGIPGTIQGVITGRLDRLPVAERELLEVAAVLGKEGSVPLLRAASDLFEPEFSSAMTHVRLAEFLRETRAVPVAEYTFAHALTQEVVYESLAPDRRRALHGAAAAAIERESPQIALRMPEVLAAHLTEAGATGPAVLRWHDAGRLAIQRSANAEAVVHLTKAVELLETTPASTDRSRQEIGVRLSLIAALSAARGYAAPELEENLARARALVDVLPESPQAFVVRWNLWRFAVSRADVRIAETLAAGLLASAERQGDAAAILNAHLAAGVNRFYLGDFDAAHARLLEALSRGHDSDSRHQIAVYGQDMAVAARGFLGWTRAVIGDLDSAARDAGEALDRARELDHPFSLALALLTAGEVHQLRREPPVVEAIGRELLLVSREHAFTFFTAFGLMFSGWGRAAGGQPAEGLATMREGASLFRTVGQRLGLAHRAHLAEMLIAHGAVQEGLDVIDHALRQSDETGEGGFVSELLRLRGTALGVSGERDQARAVLREALAVASRQGAWLFALRAAIDIVRVGTGGTADAADLDALRAVVARWSPALRTGDLAAAHALLHGGPA